MAYIIKLIAIFLNFGNIPKLENKMNFAVKKYGKLSLHAAKYYKKLGILYQNVIPDIDKASYYFEQMNLCYRYIQL